VQLEIPEVASFPPQVRATKWLYQPLASGARAGAAPTLVGGSASILIVLEELDVPSSFVAVQVLVTPVVGPEIVSAGSQPLELVRGGLAITVQCRITLFPCVLPLHHPLFAAMPSIDDEIEGVSAAAEPGTAAATSETTQSATTGLSASRIAYPGGTMKRAEPIVL
jgi:hypothetical protein